MRLWNQADNLEIERETSYTHLSLLTIENLGVKDFNKFFFHNYSDKAVQYWRSQYHQEIELRRKGSYAILLLAQKCYRYIDEREKYKNDLSKLSIGEGDVEEILSLCAHAQFPCHPFLYISFLTSFLNLNTYLKNPDQFVLVEDVRSYLNELLKKKEARRLIEWLEDIVYLASSDPSSYDKEKDIALAEKSLYILRKVNDEDYVKAVCQGIASSNGFDGFVDMLIEEIQSFNSEYPASQYTEAIEKAFWANKMVHYKGLLHWYRIIKKPLSELLPFFIEGVEEGALIDPLSLELSSLNFGSYVQDKEAFKRDLERLLTAIINTKNYHQIDWCKTFFCDLKNHENFSSILAWDEKIEKLEN